MEITTQPRTRPTMLGVKLAAIFCLTGLESPVVVHVSVEVAMLAPAFSRSAAAVVTIDARG